MRTLRNGSRGHDVEFMQRLLVLADAREHADYPFFGSDGVFGPETERAIRAFQRRHPGLVVDGVVGAQTWTALGLRQHREHAVTLRGQPDNDSCWATAAGMIDASNMATPGEVALGSTGRLRNDFSNIETFARVLGWRMPDHSPEIPELVGWLMRTPVWLGVTNAVGGHAVILSGVYSDGQRSGNGTMVRVHDPWPPRRGSIYGSFLAPLILHDQSSRVVVSLNWILIPPT